MQVVWCAVTRQTRTLGAESRLAVAAASGSRRSPEQQAALTTALATLRAVQAEPGAPTIMRRLLTVGPDNDPL
jgi:hypothetical protein